MYNEGPRHDTKNLIKKKQKFKMKIQMVTFKSARASLIEALTPSSAPPP